MISNHDAELIAQTDANLLKEKEVKGYVTVNRYQYYTLINVWTALVKAYNPIAAAILEDYIRKHGLLATIRDAADTADDIIRNNDVKIPSFAIMASGLDTSDVLLILRFPKRFTPISASLEEKTIDTFLDTLERAKRINRRRFLTGCRFIIDSVRDELATMLSSYNCDFSEIYLTNGISVSPDMEHTYKTHYEKISHLQRPNYWDCTYYGTGALPTVTLPNGRPDFNVRHFGACARVSVVPKSYKTYRTIAVETVDKQSDQQCIRVALENALYKSVGDHAPIHNQTINGLLAGREGFSTIDLTAASDSLNWWLMHEVLPRQVFEDCSFARSFYLQLPSGRVIENPIFCTMGNGFCFALETAVFLAIARAATKSWCRFTGTVFNDDFCWAYGDDIIVYTPAYEYVVEWLERLDFIVNREKSFSTGDLFRESCGFDWYEGDLVTSIYWPRATITEHLDSCASLIALENRLFMRGNGYKFFEAYTFLINQIHRIEKKVSEVPLDWFLEYNLEGKTLVTLTAEAPWHFTMRDYAWPDAPYEEEQYYCRVLEPTHQSGSVTGGARIETYLYYKFLKEGPKYEDGLCELLRVSTSYRDERLSQKPDGFALSMKRLF